MTTVREINSLLPEGKTIQLAYNGLAVDFDKRNNLHLIAFGDYVVRQIYPMGKDGIELEIETQPITKE